MLRPFRHADALRGNGMSQKIRADQPLDEPVLTGGQILGQINVPRYSGADAIKLAHLKTFTADALLIPYYIEVEQVFKEQFEAIVKQYTPLDREKKYMLIKEIESIHPILKKLDNVYAHSLRQNLNKFARHVQHADRSVFEYFIFPYPLPGLTD